MTAEPLCYTKKTPHGGVTNFNVCQSRSWTVMKTQIPRPLPRPKDSGQGIRGQESALK